MSRNPDIGQELDNLEARVKGLDTVRESVKAWAQGVAQQLQANATAPDRIRAIASNIQSDIDDITGAITSNTAAEGEETGQPGQPT